MRKLIRVLLVTFLLIVIITPSAQAKGKNKNNSIRKNSGTPSTVHFNINNIDTRISNDGTCDNSANTSLGGLIYPKGSGNVFSVQN